MRTCTRRRTIDPAKARAAAGGGIGFYSLPPPPEKCCGECQQPRHSVDVGGACGDCRAAAKAKRIQAEEVPFPEGG
jgi:hypothetical protein